MDKNDDDFYDRQSPKMEKSRRKQVFNIEDDVGEEIKIRDDFEEKKKFFDDWDQLLDDENDDGPTDAVTQAEVLSFLAKIKAKHRSEFENPKEFTRRRIFHDRNYYSADMETRRAAQDVESEELSDLDNACMAPLTKKKKRSRLFRNDELLFAPNLNTKMPSRSERRNMALIDSCKILKKACGGFRFFVRKFTDQMFFRCLRNSLFDNFEGFAPRQLRYIHILRNVWWNLPDDERLDWQKLSVMYGLENGANDELDRIEPLVKSAKYLDDRLWVQTIDANKFPCPVCTRRNSKRYTITELFSHLSLSHTSIRLYACQFCFKVFVDIDLLKNHSNCCKFTEYVTAKEESDEQLIFNFVYVSLICAECGLHLILSPRCDAGSFTSSFINCLLSHSSKSFCILLVFSCAELTETHVKISFHRSFPDASLKCLECEKSEEKKDKEFRNVFELEKHLSMLHKKTMKSKKCPRCPASFFNVHVFSDHLLSHIQELPFVTVFMCSAPISSAPLERNPCIRVTSAVDFSKVVIDREEEPPENDMIANLRRSSRKRKLATPKVCEVEKLKSYNRDHHVYNWSDYCQLMTSTQNLQDLSTLKSLSEISLEIVYNGRTIVENTLNGSCLIDNVFLCQKCLTIVICNSKAIEHIKECYDLEEYVEELDYSNNHVYYLFDAKNFPLSRIRCAFCRMTHCSILALRKHCALAHAKFLRYQKNDSTIQECAEAILSKDWLTTAFDQHLLEEIKASPTPICKSEFDNGKDDDNYLDFFQITSSLDSLVDSRTPSPLLNNHNDDDEDNAENDFVINNSVSCVLSKDLICDTSLLKSKVKTEIQEESNTPSSLHLFENRSLSLCRAIPCSGEEEFIDRLSTLTKLSGVSTSASLSHALNNSKSSLRKYTCFLCHMSFDDINALTAHINDHPEKWSHCKVCVREKTWNGKEFTSLIEFFRHMKSKHVDVESQLSGCPFCNETVSTSNSLLGVSSIVRHIVYDCMATGVCFLCDDWNCSMSDRLYKKQLMFHRKTKHGLIYDRFICSACLSGFHSQDNFEKHNCAPALRCTCNPFKVFHTNHEFEAHLKDMQTDDNYKVHNAMATRCESMWDRRLFVKNDEYERFCLENNKQVTAQKLILNGSCLPKPSNAINARMSSYVLPADVLHLNKHKFSTFLKANAYFTVADQDKELYENVFNIVQSLVDYIVEEQNVNEKLDEKEISITQKRTSQQRQLLHVGQVLNASSTVLNLNDDVLCSGPKPFLTIRNGNLACNFCSFNVINLSELLHHKSLIHKFSKDYGVPLNHMTYLCRSCCYAFDKIIEYQRHMETHSLPIACKKCSCVSGKDAEFYLHRSVHHSRNAIFACTLCSIMYTQESMLLLHMAQEHKMQLLYFCKTCGICNTNLHTIYDHITQNPCRKMLTIEFIGFIDASQVQLIQSSRIFSDPSRPVEFVSLNECRHNRCLIARAEPLVTCARCNCLTTLNDFKKKSRLSKAEMKKKVNFNLANDNGKLALISILNEMAKLNSSSLRDDDELKDIQLQKDEKALRKGWRLATNAEKTNSHFTITMSPTSNVATSDLLIPTAPAVLPPVFPVVKCEPEYELSEAVKNSIFQPTIDDTLLSSEKTVLVSVKKESKNVPEVNTPEKEDAALEKASVESSEDSVEDVVVLNEVRKKQLPTLRRLAINGLHLQRSKPLTFLDKVGESNKADGVTLNFDRAARVINRDVHINQSYLPFQKKLVNLSYQNKQKLTSTPVRGLKSYVLKYNINQTLEKKRHETSIGLPDSPIFSVPILPSTSSTLQKTVNRPVSSSIICNPQVTSPFVARSQLTEMQKQKIFQKKGITQTFLTNVPRINTSLNPRPLRLQRPIVRPEVSLSVTSTTQSKYPPRVIIPQRVVKNVVNPLFPQLTPIRGPESERLEHLEHSLTPRPGMGNIRRLKMENNTFNRQEQPTHLPSTLSSSRIMNAEEKPRCTSINNRLQPLSKLPLSVRLNPSNKLPNARSSTSASNESALSDSASLLDNLTIVTSKLNFMKNRSVQDKYLCMSCNATHERQSDAVMHQFYDHDIQELRYSLKCPVCHTIFNDLTLFYAHIVTNKKHTMLTYQSKWCNFSFKSASETRRHDYEHEMMVDALNMPCGVNCCGICGTVKNYWFERYGESKTFIDHTVFHGFRSMTVCRLCNDVFPNDVNGHKATVHFQNKHVRVQFCRPETMDVVEELTDNENNMYFCKHCLSYINFKEIAEHYTDLHMYTLIEFVPELKNELVIYASDELMSRFFRS